MNGFKFMVELEVKESSEIDILKGWVRINKDSRKGIEKKAICSIKVKNKDKEIFREIRGTNKKDIINMDYDSRYELGVKVDEKIDFEIKQLKWWNQYKFYRYHPETGIRLSMILGIISLVLGFISLVISVLGIESVRLEIYSKLLALYHLVFC